MNRSAAALAAASPALAYDCASAALAAAPRWHKAHFRRAEAAMAQHAFEAAAADFQAALDAAPPTTSVPIHSRISSTSTSKTARSRAAMVASIGTLENDCEVG